MGSNHSSDLSEEDIEEIRQNTRFTRREITELYEKFLSDFPEGVISRRRFVDMYSSLFPDGDATRFAKHVFRAYDADGNGEVDFHEFMTSLSCATKGTAEDKLKWAFHLYDIDGDGEITRPEATEMIMAIYRMQGIPNPRVKAEQATTGLFYQLDKDGDESLSRGEFVRAVSNSNAIKDLLQGSM